MFFSLRDFVLLVCRERVLMLFGGLRTHAPRHGPGVFWIGVITAQLSAFWGEALSWGQKKKRGILKTPPDPLPTGPASMVTWINDIDLTKSLSGLATPNSITGVATGGLREMRVEDV